jgi:hypothetical protein
VKGDSPASEVRICLQDSPVLKPDTADRQNTAGEGITKNPGAGIQDREDKVSSLYCVMSNCSSARWKSK